MLIFGLTIMELIAIGTLIVSALWGYWRLSASSDASEKQINRFSEELKNQIHNIKEDFDEKLDQILLTNEKQYSYDKDWRKNQERRIDSLELQSRQQESSQAAMSASLVAAAASLSEIKSGVAMLTTRFDHVILQTLHHPTNKGDKN